jgi:hypothetical protein
MFDSKVNHCLIDQRCASILLTKSESFDRHLYCSRIDRTHAILKPKSSIDQMAADNFIF